MAARSVDSDTSYILWQAIDQMAELFQKSRSTINEHILNIYEEQELDSQDSVRKIGNSDFSTTHQLLQPGCHYLKQAYQTGNRNSQKLLLKFESNSPTKRMTKHLKGL